MCVLRLSWTTTILSAAGKCTSDKSWRTAHNGSVVVGHFHAAPALQRHEYHEEIGDAVALVFVVVTGGLSGLGRNATSRLGDQLVGALC